MTAQVAQMIQYTNDAGVVLPAVVRGTPETYPGSPLPEGQLEVTVFGNHCDYRRRVTFNEAAGMATPVQGYGKTADYEDPDEIEDTEGEDAEGIAFGNGPADD